MKRDFSEKQFIIKMINEFSKSEVLWREQPLLLKMAGRLRDKFLKEELQELLDLYRREESHLKLSLLQAIKANQWSDSERLSHQISKVSEARIETELRLKSLAA
jgi:HPt (histidine-containing phosphotransfer) domain-containing protein